MMIIPSNNGYQWLYNHYITIDLSLGDIWWFIVNSSGYHFFSMKHWALRHHQGIPTCRCRILVPGPPLEPLEVGFPGTWAFQWSDATQNMLVESGYWQLYTSYTTKVIGLNHIQSYEKWISQYRKTVQKNDQPYCLGTPIRSPINQYFLTAGFRWSSDLARFQIFGIELRAATLW